MGIWGLTSFIKRYGLGETIFIEEIKLVIDCWSLVYYIFEKHELDPFYGGQTYHFYEIVKDFLLELVELGTNVRVVCDGFTEPKMKGKTKIDRMNRILNNQNENQTLKFTFESFYAQIVGDACRELEIPFIVVKGEADRKIAILADTLGAYILAYDSDYCIYDTYPGYINLHTIKRVKYGILVGDVISYRDIASKLKLPVSKLALFALLCGNDYFDSYKLAKSFGPNRYEGSERIFKIAEFMRKFTKTAEIIHEFKRHLSGDDLTRFNEKSQKILDCYRIDVNYQEKNRCEIFQDLMDIEENWETPICLKFWERVNITKTKWLTMLFNQGKLCGNFYSAVMNEIHFLSIPAQDHNLSSVHDCANFIRIAIYSIMCCNKGDDLEISVYDRVKNLYKHRFTATIYRLNGIALELIRQDNRSYFINEINVLPPPYRLTSISEKMNVTDIDLVLITLKYIRKNSNVDYSISIWRIFFFGLLRGFLLDEFSKKMFYFKSDFVQKHESKIIHLIGEYTATIGCVHALNLLLGQPFVPVPEKYWLDGPLIIDTFVNQLKSNISL